VWVRWEQVASLHLPLRTRGLGLNRRDSTRHCWSVTYTRMRCGGAALSHWPHVERLGTVYVAIQPVVPAATPRALLRVTAGEGKLAESSHNQRAPTRGGSRERKGETPAWCRRGESAASAPLLWGRLPHASTRATVVIPFVPHVRSWEGLPPPPERRSTGSKALRRLL
jgi:hypothetical protein